MWTRTSCWRRPLNIKEDFGRITFFLTKIKSNLLESRVAGDFEGPSTAEVPDWQAELDIFEDIDTVAVALEGREVDSIAVAMVPAQRLEAAHPCTVRDFDPKDRVIVLEMCLPAGRIKIKTDCQFDVQQFIFVLVTSFQNMLERFSQIVFAFRINFNSNCPH